MQIKISGKIKVNTNNLEDKIRKEYKDHKIFTEEDNGKLYLEIKK